ncbi:MAG TPA: GAF domain-containing protein [Trebonia sp.]|nr:GAF domain-containing protein [Trebonia sp.]
MSSVEAVPASGAARLAPASEALPADEKTAAYGEAIGQLGSILAGESHVILKMATINCVLREALPYYYWTGFYLVHEGELVVGPYQGTLGCLHIAFDRGVCGAAARTGAVQVVPDVELFPGHIACDSRTRSEICVPVYDRAGALIAVFDVDSTEPGSFDAVDEDYLTRIMSEHFAH